MKDFTVMITAENENDLRLKVWQLAKLLGKPKKHATDKDVKDSVERFWKSQIVNKLKAD